MPGSWFINDNLIRVYSAEKLFGPHDTNYTTTIYRLLQILTNNDCLTHTHAHSETSSRAPSWFDYNSEASMYLH